MCQDVTEVFCCLLGSLPAFEFIRSLWRFPRVTVVDEVMHTGFQTFTAPFSALYVRNFCGAGIRSAGRKKQKNVSGRLRGTTVFTRWSWLCWYSVEANYGVAGDMAL
eukprot:899551-Prorocentrum_minimum.AAC.2